jgi:hypothetical protein
MNLFASIYDRIIIEIAVKKYGHLVLISSSALQLQEIIFIIVNFVANRKSCGVLIP